MRFLILFILILSNPLKATLLRVGADYWCPYNCNPESDFEGIALEVLRSAVGAIGVDYQLMPWETAVQKARSGEALDVIVGAGKEDAPDFIFPEEPFAYAVYAFYGLPESDMHPKGVSDFKSGKLGVIKGYTYDQETNKAIDDKVSYIYPVFGDNALEQLFFLTQKKRVLGFIENPAVFKYKMTNSAQSLETFKELGRPNMKPQPLYIAISPNYKDAKNLRAKIDKTIRDLKKKGQYSRLLKKYHLN